MSRLLRAVLAASCLLALPATASAQSLTGTVVGVPKLTARSAVVPIVDARGTARKLVVPARGAIRARIGRLTAGQLRYGDAIRATGSSAQLTGARPRATLLRVGTRGSSPTFDTIAANRSATVAQLQGAVAQLQALPPDTDAVTALDAAPAETRSKLRDVRTAVNLTIADLRSQATALDAIAARAPAAGATLTPLAGDARAAADALDDAVAQLDTTINAVGTTSPPPLPIGTVSTVSDVFRLVLGIVSRLPGGIDAP